MPVSRYEAMRTDPANWTLGVVYRCADDPRIVVRNLLPFGWTWNFAHRRAWPAIALAIFALLGPVALAARAGVESLGALAAIVLLSLGAIMLAAHRAAREPQVRE